MVTVVERGQGPAGGQSPAGAPRQLPPAPRQFVGRAEELKELSELLDQVSSSGTTAVISVISGTAGVGKTALAVHWAHQVAEHFPDGQLYVNLRGFDPSGPPVRPEDAVRGFLAALGIPPERIPVGLDARTGLLRSLLAGRRMLVLLDNARDAGQVRPLLSAAPGCLTLITSRNELTSLAATHSAQLLSLDVLTGVEATELLERRLGRQRVAGEQPAVAQLTRLCARLPLALTIISARAAVRRSLPLTFLVCELRDAHGVLDALTPDPANLDAPSPHPATPDAPSLDPASPDAPNFDAPTDDPASPDAPTPYGPTPDAPSPDPDSRACTPASEADTSASRADTSASRADTSPASEADTSPAPEADTLTAGTGTPASVRAVFSWSYRQLGDQAARMFRLLGAHPGPDISIPAAASLAGIPASQAGRLLGELTSASLLTEHSAGRFTFHDLLRAYATEQARNDPAEMHTARLRALDHYLRTAFAAALLLEPHRSRITLGPAQAGVRPEPLATYQEALAWFDAELQVMLAAISLAEDRGYDVHAWQLAWTMADFLDWRGRWHDWSATQQIALDACIRLGDLVGQGHARRSLARACNEQGRYDDTRSHLTAALNLFRETGDVLGRARCHIDMAAVLERQSSYDVAIEHAEHALELFRDVSYAPGQANALNAIGWCHAMAGHHALALSYCQQAIDLQRELGDKLCEAGTWDSLGYAHHHLGQYRDAIACYRRALEFCQEVGHRRNQAEILDHLAETQQASGDAVAARASWRQALNILNDLNHPDADRLRARLTAPVDDQPPDSRASSVAD
jgi:tetratricopeptide (TPR) repeat protein